MFQSVQAVSQKYTNGMASEQPFVISQFWAVSSQGWVEKLKTTVLGGLHLGEISQFGLFTVPSNGVSFV